jgi:hypothetical protein
MTAQVFIALLIAAVLLVYLVIAVRTWSRVHGARVVVCPETQRPVTVRVDVARAVASAVWESPDLAVTSCSRWPARQDCDQPCVRQIETAPADTSPKVIAAHFFARQHCAICSSPIAPLSAVTQPPGLMDPATHRVERWNDIAPQDLPQAIATRRPLCANCTRAEAFRRRVPDRVTDREHHD